MMFLYLILLLLLLFYQRKFHSLLRKNNLHNIPPIILSPRHSQLPSLSSPPYIHNFISPEDTIFDNSSTDSPKHNDWQPTKIHAPTPPPMNFSDIPITSVNSIFNQPYIPLKFIHTVASHLIEIRLLSFSKSFITSFPLRSP